MCAIDVNRYSQFVDYGSGKGRALLVASDFPFEVIRGVEFSQDLHAIAQENIHRYLNPKQVCRNIESVYGDAIEFAPAEISTVHFFYSPFRQNVMQAVCKNIESSLSTRPRESMIVFYGLHAETIAAIDALGWHRYEIQVPRDFGASGKYKAIVYQHSPKTQPSMPIHRLLPGDFVRHKSAGQRKSQWLRFKSQ